MTLNNEQAPVEENQQNYPSAELAYEIAVNSHETAQKRYDAIDARIQTWV
jgi:hypothetical protein